MALIKGGEGGIVYTIILSNRVDGFINLKKLLGTRIKLKGLRNSWYHLNMRIIISDCIEVLCRSQELYIFSLWACGCLSFLKRREP